MSGGTTRRKEQENSLTQLIGTSHTIKSIANMGTHLLSARVMVNRNTSPAPTASPFGPNRNSATPDGPIKAVGAKRQCQTPSGALTLHSGSLAKPDRGRKRGLFGSLSGTASLGRNLHKPLAKIRHVCESRRRSLRRFQSRQSRT